MTRALILRVTITVSLLFMTCGVGLNSHRAIAQDQQQRGLKVKVGATRTEMTSGRAKDVQLWAVLIGISRFKNGDQDVGGMPIQNLLSAADAAQAIYEFLRSEEGG